MIFFSTRFPKHSFLSILVLTNTDRAVHQIKLTVKKWQKMVAKLVCDVRHICPHTRKKNLRNRFRVKQYHQIQSPNKAKNGHRGPSMRVSDDASEARDLRGDRGVSGHPPNGRRRRSHRRSC